MAAGRAPCDASHTRERRLRHRARHRTPVYGLTMTIVDDLLANPGLYVGVDDVQDSELRGAARIVVAPLPGNAGVTIDYEVLNPNNDPIRGHIEHTVLAR